MEHCQLQTLNSFFKGACVGPITEVIFANQMNYKNFTFRILPEKIFAMPVAMYLQKNHFLVKDFEEVVSKLHSSGLVNYWIGKYLNPMYLNYQSNSVNKKAMTFEQISGIFFVWLGSCCVSIICFFTEKTCQKIIFRKQNEKTSLKISNNPIEISIPPLKRVHDNERWKNKTRKV